jgi:hypothetical protein
VSNEVKVAGAEIELGRPAPPAFINDWLVTENCKLRRTGVIGAWTLEADEPPSDRNYTQPGNSGTGCIVVMQGGVRWYVDCDWKVLTAWLDGT